MSDERDLFTPRTAKPSCPVCGRNEFVHVANHPAGRYACGGTTPGAEGGGCWTLFDGGDHEWHSWRSRREIRASSNEYHRAKWAAYRDRHTPKTEAA